MSEAIEAKLLYLRQANPNEPAELFISHGGDAYIVYRLRPTQLDQLAVDAPRMALSRKVQ